MGVAENAGHENVRHGRCDTKMQRRKMPEKVCVESHNNVAAAEYIVCCFTHKELFISLNNSYAHSIWYLVQRRKIYMRSFISVN